MNGKSKAMSRRLVAALATLTLTSGAAVGLATTASAAPVASVNVAFALRGARVSSPDGFANVRSGAGMSHPVVMTLTNGSTVTVHETRSGWSRIGTNQWVASWLLRDGTAETQPVLWRVQIGASQSQTRANEIAATARARGFQTFVRKVGSWYRVQVGAFEVRANADAMVTRARNAGFADAWARSD